MLVVHPGEDNDFGFGVEPEEQPEAPSNLGSTPMSERRAHGVALSEFLAVGIAWNCLQDQLRKGVVKFDVGV